ncbi:hypothetical protein [Novosphingobium sp.]|uniref:hypothetical protein n=1 Tax=Novosphingobium sp. TaxID=1874826 RepID=UPI003BA97FB5
MNARREPGWDAKAISAVIAQHYDGRLANLFQAHGWPERGQAMMPAQGQRIVSVYGSVEAFERAHQDGLAGNQVLNPLATLEGPDPKVVLTAYWGFTPEDWPCLTFTDEGRLRTILAETQPGFLGVVYGNNTASVPKEMRGRVVGIYQLSHQTGDTETFLSPAGLKRKHEVEPKAGSWNHAFRALRAWQVAPDSAPLVSDFANETYATERGMAISRFGAFLTRTEARKILDLELVPRPLFGAEMTSDFVLERGRDALKPSRPGPVSQSAYMVREAEGPKHLYILQLEGNADHFLGYASEGRRIIKVGFSRSPAVRRDDHNRALPAGAYRWRILKSTLDEGLDPYPVAAHAKAGEQAMISDLIHAGRPLGGEFFLADDEAIERTWAIGKNTAGSASA